MYIFQFPIDPTIRHKWLEKCYPKDKFDKSTRMICSIYISMAAFIENIKFPLSNQNINNLMLINPVLLFQRIAELSPPSYILYTLAHTPRRNMALSGS